LTIGNQSEYFTITDCENTSNFVPNAENNQITIEDTLDKIDLNLNSKKSMIKKQSGTRYNEPISSSSSSKSNCQNDVDTMEDTTDQNESKFNFVNMVQGSIEVNASTDNYEYTLRTLP
jgi:hypothetical protein